MDTNVFGSFQVRRQRTAEEEGHENTQTDSESGDSASTDINTSGQRSPISSPNANLDRPPIDSGTNDADNDDSSSQEDNVPVLQQSEDDDTEYDTSSSEEDNLNYIR